MRIPIIKNKWEYEIKQNSYGWLLVIAKNKVKVYNQGGFGYRAGAERAARDYFLEDEFGIELNY